MKNLLIFPLIFALSCSQLTPEKKAVEGLEALLSPEDLKIHQCLHSRKEVTIQLKQECLKGTSYEALVSRVPSEDENEIILKNNWFFGDRSKLNQFYEISRGFVKASSKMAKKAINERGIAVEGSAFFGFGAGWLAEFINHESKFGLFCAPFITARTDAGIEAAVAVLQSVSCSSNEAYQGGFLNINAGLSGELIGLPVDLSMAYSFGLDLPGFAQKIRAAKNQKRINVAQLALEVGRLNEKRIQREIASNSNYNAAVINLVLKPLILVGIHAPGVSSLSQMNNVVRQVMKNNRSLGSQFKGYFQKKLSPYLVQNRFPQLNHFLSILTSSMTGCDSIGGAAAFSLTLSPASVGVTYENYHLLFEMAFADVRALKAVTPMMLLNPFLLSPEDLRATARVARGILAIPAKVDRQCNQLFPKI
jgi:hypothetical protein